MRLFGLLSLLITTSLIVWWFSVSHSEAVTASNQTTGSYEDSIDSAREAADMIEGRI